MVIFFAFRFVVVVCELSLVLIICKDADAEQVLLLMRSPLSFSIYTCVMHELFTQQQSMHAYKSKVCK